MSDMSANPGRSCPLSCRYGAGALGTCLEQCADTLYVVGGLYGNLPALATIEALAARERGPVKLCFNGDFNGFNVDHDGFAAINGKVLAHDALLGDVEAELFSAEGDAGCGCAYPESVDSCVVERSNTIHARLKATASRHPSIIDQLRSLPMLRRYRVGDCRVGVVHGDAESLAGWRFDVAALDDGNNRSWLNAVFAQARVDVFASTHTCLPALRRFVVDGERKIVINNGAAGMPNFCRMQAGLITRIGLEPGPHPSLYGARVMDTLIDALPVAYDHDAWRQLFLGNWPERSPAHSSYYDRIVHGPTFDLRRADPRRRPPPTGGTPA